MSRASRDDLDLLPESLRDGARPLLRIGMAVRYDHTPVGPYNELGGAIAYVRRNGVYGHIPFLPVDSAATMRGGRENWALPKVLAEFSGDPHPGSEFTATGTGWSVAVQISPARKERSLRLPGFTARIPRLPIPSLVGLEQVYPDGTRARTGFAKVSETQVEAAPVTVTVTSEGSENLRRLFAPGRYRGTAITYRGLRLGDPRLD